MSFVRLICSILHYVCCGLIPLHFVSGKCSFYQDLWFFIVFQIFASHTLHFVLFSNRHFSQRFYVELGFCVTGLSVSVGQPAPYRIYRTQDFALLGCLSHSVTSRHRVEMTRIVIPFTVFTHTNTIFALLEFFYPSLSNISVGLKSASSSCGSGVKEMIHQFTW